MNEYEPLRPLAEGEKWWEDPRRVGSLCAAIIALGGISTTMTVLFLLILKGVTSLLW